MRSVALIVCVAACGFDVPGGANGDGTRIVDDTQADFAAGTFTDAVATTWGTLEPAAFVLGGLHASGYDGNDVLAGDSYDDVVARLAETKLRGDSYREVPIDFDGMTRPRGLGLALNTDFTVLY